MSEATAEVPFDILVGCCSPQGERATVYCMEGGLPVLFKLSVLDYHKGKELSRRGVAPFLPYKASYGQSHCSVVVQLSQEMGWSLCL